MMEQTNQNPVQVVTVKQKIPLFKGEEQANAIELIQLTELGYEVVAQKDLYQIGDKAVFIEPDYSIPDTKLFESYIRPQGDPKKTRLGSNNRIRAIKFNLHRGDDMPTYSQGILLPLEVVQSYCFGTVSGQVEYYLRNIDLMKTLEITKWEAPDENQKGGVKRGNSKPFPTGMYKTDETNVNKLWDKLEFPMNLVVTKKKDGSSVSIYYKNGKYGICSRNLEKPLYIQKIVGQRNKTLLEKILFWKKFNPYIYEEVLNDSDFVKVGKKYLDRLVEYCEDNRGLCLVLRGELIGQGSKGSGNKNNPDAKGSPDIHFYGADLYYNISEKLEENGFKFLCQHLGLTRCDIVFEQMFDSKEHLQQTCDKYFKDNMIEGLVARTYDSKISMKIMNPEYDSKK